MEGAEGGGAPPRNSAPPSLSSSTVTLTLPPCFNTDEIEAREGGREGSRSAQSNGICLQQTRVG